MATTTTTIISRIATMIVVASEEGEEGGWWGVPEVSDTGIWARPWKRRRPSKESWQSSPFPARGSSSHQLVSSRWQLIEPDADNAEAEAGFYCWKVLMRWKWGNWGYLVNCQISCGALVTQKWTNISSVTSEQIFQIWQMWGNISDLVHLTQRVGGKSVWSETGVSVMLLRLICSK